MVNFVPPSLDFDESKWEVKYSFVNNTVLLDIDFIDLGDGTYDGKLEFYGENDDGTMDLIFCKTFMTPLNIRMDSLLEYAKELYVRTHICVSVVNSGGFVQLDNHMAEILTATVEVDGELIEVPREVFALNSSFFQVLFYKDYKDCNKDSIKLQSLSFGDCFLLQTCIVEIPSKSCTRCLQPTQMGRLLRNGISRKRCLKFLLKHLQKNPYDFIPMVFREAEELNNNDMMMTIVQSIFSFNDMRKITDTLVAKNRISEENKQILKDLFQKNDQEEMERMMVERPQAFIDFKCGRVIIELFYDECPATCFFFLKTIKRR